MAVIPAVCDSYTKEILEGVHTSADIYKIALFNSGTATLNASTTTYTTTGEVSGQGYTAGGQALTGFSASVSNGVAILDFNDVTWANATITADSALIYNSSKGNKAVGVFDIGVTSSTNGAFTIIFPSPTSTTGLIRIS